MSRIRGVEHIIKERTGAVIVCIHNAEISERSLGNGVKVYSMSYSPNLTWWVPKLKGSDMSVFSSASGDIRGNMKWLIRKMDKSDP